MRPLFTILTLCMLATGGCSTSHPSPDATPIDAGAPDAPVPPPLASPPKRPAPEKQRRELAKAVEESPDQPMVDAGDMPTVDAGPAGEITDAGVWVIDLGVDQGDPVAQPLFTVDPLPTVPPLHVVAYPNACADTEGCCRVPHCTDANLDPVDPLATPLECAQRSARLNCVQSCYTLYDCCFEATGGDLNGECTDILRIDGHAYFAWCTQQAAANCPADFMQAR